ncbi:MAG: hypothetical protein ACKOE4_07505 [Candidatus Kapaibacterium sp.]
MVRTGTVLVASSGNVIDLSTGQPTGQITIDVGELISFNDNNATDYGTYWIINTGSRVIYPAQSGQIVETLEPVLAQEASGDGLESTTSQ